MQTPYDAAGLGRQVWDYSVTSTTQWADGDGEAVKRAEARQNEAGQPEVITTYYVRSSVLGKIVSELDDRGQQLRGLVYLGSEILAEQRSVVGQPAGQVWWRHENPQTGSAKSSYYGGSYDPLASSEYDASGVEVGRSDSYRTIIIPPESEGMAPLLA